jgi:hypothetical protein
VEFILNWHRPLIFPDILLLDLLVDNGHLVLGSSSPDNYLKIGCASRNPSILFMEGNFHGNLA